MVQLLFQICKPSFTKTSLLSKCCLCSCFVLLSSSWNGYLHCWWFLGCSFIIWCGSKKVKAHRTQMLEILCWIFIDWINIYRNKVAETDRTHWIFGCFFQLSLKANGKFLLRCKQSIHNFFEPTTSLNTLVSRSSAYHDLQQFVQYLCSIPEILGLWGLGIVFLISYVSKNLVITFFSSCERIISPYTFLDLLA